MSRRLWLRVNAIAFAILFLACLLALGWLSTRYEASWQWAGAAHRLSEPSQRLLAQLDGPVQVTAFVPSGHFLERHVNGLLERYARHKSDIEWELVNPQARPDLVRRLGIQGTGELILEYHGRREQVSAPTEAHVSAALERLHRGVGQRVGYFSGHGARRLTGEANHDLGAFGSALQGKGYRLEPLKLASAGEVPQGIDLLVVAGPRGELLPGEVQALHRYLGRGGSLLWLVEPDDAQRLEVLVEATGLQPQPGVLVDQEASEQLAFNDPRLALLEEYPQHPISQRLQAPILLPHAASLGVLEEQAWEMQPLLVSSARHRLVLDYDGDAVTLAAPKGAERLLLAAALSRTLGEGEQARLQRAVVVGDGDFLSNTYIGNGANLQLGLNIVDWLTESEVFLDLYTQAAPDQRLDLSRGATLFIGFGFLLGLPLAFLGLGGWRWWRRRSG
jgi:ABC-type uncharacterized transport system involved in gliding motility auxiliary subunit